MSDYPHIDPQKPLIVVVDLSVYLHRLHQTIPMDHSDPQFESILKSNLVYLMSGNWLPEALKPLYKNMIFCIDSKPYWRSDWLMDLRNTVDLPKPTLAKSEAGITKATQNALKIAQEIKEAMDAPIKTNEQLELINIAQVSHTVAYKAGRKFPAYSFKKIRMLVYRYLELINAQRLFCTGFEADDMAAALVATNTAKGNPANIMLLTVDTDWMGLINPSVTWVCMTGYAPAFRDTLEICNAWAKKSLKATLGTWREIWDIKGQKGDKSDNLPPSNGLLLPVIDLLNPPAQYRYWEQQKGLLHDCFGFHTGLRFSPEAGRAALHHLKLNGLRPVMRSLEPALGLTNSTNEIT